MIDPDSLVVIATHLRPEEAGMLRCAASTSLDRDRLKRLNGRGPAWLRAEGGWARTDKVYG